MKNRKLPFGYCMNRGLICINQDEAEIVHMLFESYLMGKSYSQLASALSVQSIPYNTGSAWNKNMVARILQNRTYVGERDFPPIIAQDLFLAVEKICESKKVDMSSDTKTVRSLVRCAICEEKMTRTYQKFWRCPHCADTPIKKTDDDLINSIQPLLMRVIKKPGLVNRNIVSSDNTKIQNINDELEQEINKPSMDETVARQLVFSLAAAHFDAISSADYETIRIHHILTNAVQSEKADMTLLQQIASAALLYPDGSVSIKLKNGQIFGRSVAP